MFTGIIQAIGKVVKYDGKRPPLQLGGRPLRSSGGRLWIAAPFKGIRLGESVAIDGVCLTVAARQGAMLAFDVGKETGRVTTLKNMMVGARVNMERALRVGDRLGGHWVSGHVEKTGRLLKIEKNRQSWLFTFNIPSSLRRYVVPKGSVTIDGISLTVAQTRKSWAKIMIIPHTLSHTTLKDKNVGDKVNIEPDLIAKFVLNGRHPRRLLAGDPWIPRLRPRGMTF